MCFLLKFPQYRLFWVDGLTFTRLIYYVSERIHSVPSIGDKYKNNCLNFNDSCFTKHQFLLEMIAYWNRKSISVDNFDKKINIFIVLNIRQTIFNNYEKKIFSS